MKKSPQKLHKYHIKNRQAIDGALKRVGLALRQAISRNDQKTIGSFVPVYALLLGAWAECRLLELLYEPNGFCESDRQIICGKGKSQIDQWMAAVEIAFRKQYKRPKAKLRSGIFPHSAWSRFESLQEMLDNDLRHIIEIRNKLAHGQWAYPLNNAGTDIAQEQMNVLREENLLSLQYKKKLIALLSMAIHDLIVSKDTFERSFDDHYRKIEEVRRNLKKRQYQHYVDQQTAKYQRGRDKAKSLHKR